MGHRARNWVIGLGIGDGFGLSAGIGLEDDLAGAMALVVLVTERSRAEEDAFFIRFSDKGVNWERAAQMFGVLILGDNGEC